MGLALTGIGLALFQTYRLSEIENAKSDAPLFMSDDAPRTIDGEEIKVQREAFL